VFHSHNPLSFTSSSDTAQRGHAGAGRIGQLFQTLSNAAAAKGLGEPWTLEDIPKRLDPQLVVWLQSQIMEYSGLELKKDAPGESVAVMPYRGSNKNAQGRIHGRR